MWCHVRSRSALSQKTCKQRGGLLRPHHEHMHTINTVGTQRVFVDPQSGYIHGQWILLCLGRRIHQPLNSTSHSHSSLVLTLSVDYSLSPCLHKRGARAPNGETPAYYPISTAHSLFAHFGTHFCISRVHNIYGGRTHSSHPCLEPIFHSKRYRHAWEI